MKKIKKVFFLPHQQKKNNHDHFVQYLNSIYVHVLPVFSLIAPPL